MAATRRAPTKEEIEIANKLALMTDPNVRRAYAADPKTQIANSLMRTGMDTGPAAGGKYAAMDGIARMLSGVAGGYIGKKQQDKFNAADNVAGGEALDAAEPVLAAAATPPPAPVMPAQPASPIAPPVNTPETDVVNPVSTPPPTTAPPTPPVPPTVAPQVASALMPSGAEPPPPLLENPTMAPTPTMIGGRGAANDAGVTPTMPRTTIASMVNWAKDQGARVTSVTRSVGQNKAVGGVSNSYHLSGRAFDSVPPKGVGMDEWENKLKSQYPNMDVINEGDHVHVEPMGRTQVAAMAEGQGGPDEAPPPVAELVPEPTRPERPAFRDQVRSDRLTIAHNLLQSKTDLSPSFRRGLVDQYATPDAFAENQAAKQAQVDNEAKLDAEGYRAGLADYGAKSQARYGAQIGERELGLREGVDRRAREQGYGFQNSNREDTQEFLAGESQKDRDARLALFNRQSDVRNEQFLQALAARGEQAALDYWNKPSGRKDWGERMAEVETMKNSSATADRVLSTLDDLDTGGITYMGLPGNIRSAYSSDVSRLKALQIEAVTNKLGGKLGAGVSNADFAALKAGTQIGPEFQKDAIREEALKLKAVSSRRADQHLSYIKYGGSDLPKFTSRWERFISENPLFDKQGKPRSRTLSYDEWMNFTAKNRGK